MSKEKQDTNATADLSSDGLQVINREVLDTMIAAAAVTEPVFQLPDGRVFANIPEDFQLREITDPNILPKHIKQSVTVDEGASLAAYANRFRNDQSILIADYDAGKISACLDWHKSNEGDDSLTRQHASHICTLVLRDSEEYKRWNEMENALHSQEEFAYFIEENVMDVADPEPGVLIEICRELEATQGVSFKSGTRLDNGDRSFTYETETHVKSQMVVPTKIVLQIPLYQGEQPVDIKANFRFRPRPDGLKLGFNWHRVEYQREATFREMAHKAAEATGLPVYFGRAHGA